MPADRSPGARLESPARLGLSLRRPGLPAAPTGLLEDLGGRYRFRYVTTVQQLPDFRPLIGFPTLHHTYTASRLFPFFSQRVLQPDRPDFGDYAHLLRLPVTASTWDLLARSGGTRKGDRYELLAEPHVDTAGLASSTFFVRGLHFAPNGPDATQAQLVRLRPGDPLKLQPEPGNTVNPNAHLICDSRDFPLGWVPDLLLPQILSAAATPHLTVTAINPPPAPWHLRLLASLEAHVQPGFRLFSQPGWAPIATADDTQAQTAVPVP